MRLGASPRKRWTLVGAVVLCGIFFAVSMILLNIMSGLVPKGRATLIVKPGNKRDASPAGLSAVTRVLSVRLGKRLESITLEGNSVRVVTRTYGPWDAVALRKLILMPGVVSLRAAKPGQPASRPVLKRYYDVDSASVRRLPAGAADAVVLRAPAAGVEMKRAGKTPRIKLVPAPEDWQAVSKWPPAVPGKSFFALVDGRVLGKAHATGNAVHIEPHGYLKYVRRLDFVRIMRSGPLPMPLALQAEMLPPK